MDTHLLLSLDTTAVPAELRLFCYGPNSTRKGELLFDAQAAEAVMAAYAQHGADLPFDWDHGMVRGHGDPKASGEAAGWFNLEVRPDGLWATNIRFTDDASNAIKAGKWRYVSPAVLCDKSKRITKLINVALTNLPAMDNIQPLTAKDEPEKEQHRMKDTLCLTLGLKEDLGEPELIKHLIDLNNHNLELLSLTKQNSFEQAVGVLQAWRAGYEQNIATQLEIEKLQAERASAQKQALIEANKAKFSPSMREWANGQSLEALSAFVAVAPDLVTLSEKAPVEAPKDELSAVERRVIKSFGLTEEAFLATKQSQKVGK